MATAFLVRINRRNWCGIPFPVCGAGSVLDRVEPLFDRHEQGRVPRRVDCATDPDSDFPSQTQAVRSLSHLARCDNVAVGFMLPMFCVMDIVALSQGSPDILIFSPARLSRESPSRHGKILSKLIHGELFKRTGCRRWRSRQRASRSKGAYSKSSLKASLMLPGTDMIFMNSVMVRRGKLRAR